MAEQLGSAVLTVSVDDTQLRAGLQAAERQAITAGKSIQAAFSALAGGLASIGIGVSVVGFLKGSVDQAVELESVSKKLSNTLGTQGAAGALAFTRGLSDQLGLSFKTLAGSFASFTAAASAANVPLAVQQNLFAAVSKAAQQLGLSNDEINGSLLALQQIASKGNVQMEELRGQLGERLPIAFAAAARGLNLTQQELIKLIEGGKLSAREFFPALTKGLNELTKTSEGAPTAAQNFQKLQNAWDNLQASFGTNLLPTVTKSVVLLTNTLDGLAAKQKAIDFTNSFGLGANDAQQLVGLLRQLQQQYNLTDKEAKNLLSNAAASAIPNRNTFAEYFVGQQDLGGQAFAQLQLDLINRAKAFREANKDNTAEFKAQEAEAARLLEISNARAKAEKDILIPARQALADARAIQGLQGLALAQAQEQLKVDQLRRTERQAIASYDKTLSGSGFNRESPAVIEAAAKVEAAGMAVQAALVAGSDALQQASKDAAQRFTDAARQLTEAQLQLSSVRANPEGLNRFLRPDEQFQRVRSAILSLGPELQAAIKRGQELLNSQGVGVGRPLFEGLNNILNNARIGRFASTDGLSEIQQFIKDVNAERDAISGVNNAQKNLQDINLELTQVNSSLRDQVQALVAKQWQVTVNVPGGSASGDVIGVVNGAF